MNGSRKNAGFTLIELLVVVSIIALLIALLVPALGKARTSAKIAAVKLQMEGIVRACEQYHTDFNAYPGPIDDRAIDGAAKFTAAQNLYLGLTTRFYPNKPTNGAKAAPAPYAAVGASPAGITYFDADASTQMASYAITTEHPDLPVVVTGQPNCFTFDRYLTPKPGDSSTGTLYANSAAGLALQMRDPANNTPPLVLPSFVDSAFGSDARPILYYRQDYKWDFENANTGTGVAAVANTRFASQTSADKFTTAQACFYTNTNTLVDPTVPATQALLDPIVGVATGSKIGATAIYKPKGDIVLVSPGPDRVYGTADDIIVAGGQ